MADEVGPLRAETDVLRGALPDRLTEAALTYAEMTRASVPWLTGQVDVPLAQLKDLADWAAAMQVACGAVVTEARRVYRDTTRRRAAA